VVEGREGVRGELKAVELLTHTEQQSVSVWRSHRTTNSSLQNGYRF